MRGEKRVTQVSPLAGVTAGTAAVLFAFGVLALAWHRVAGQVSTGITVLVYVLIAAVCGLAVAALFYAVLWLRHRVLHPETLARVQVVQAELAEDAPARISAQPLAPLAYEPAAAVEPPREVHNHFHFPDADTAAAVVHAMRDREIQP